MGQEKEPKEEWSPPSKATIWPTAFTADLQDGYTQNVWLSLGQEGEERCVVEYCVEHVLS